MSYISVYLVKLQAENDFTMYVVLSQSDRRSLLMYTSFADVVYLILLIWTVNNAYFLLIFVLSV